MLSVKRFNFKKLFSKYLSLLNVRRNRLILMIFYDFFSICISIFLSLYLLKNLIGQNFIINIPLLFFINLLHISLYVIFKIYKNLLEFFNSNLVYKLILLNLVPIIIFSTFSNLIFNNNLPFIFYIIALSVVNTLSILPRIIIRDFINNLNNFNDSHINTNLKKIVVYGAGSAGVKLTEILLLDKKYKILFFIDDNKDLQNRFIKNIPIKSLKYLDSFNHKEIDQILFAMPSNTAKQTRKIIEKISKYEIKVLNVPKLNDLLSYKYSITDLRELTAEDIIGRDIVSINMNKSLGIKNKCVCITGAGGSIGHELFKEISTLNPKFIVLVDNSEYNLYKLNQYINENFIYLKKFSTILEDVTNQKALEKIFKEYKVDYIFHSAAYKHVPIVEQNPISGIRNNIISTLSICNAASKLSVEKVILISSDKAVRPTNIMGVTKRVSELIFLAFSDKKLSNNTVFSMVRFGNVLNSSGSVLPLFNDQIKTGGPLTVTHPKVKRYFMTISEAAKLVIQSSEYSRGGDLFILDMGEQVSIMDLAKKMIKLNGLSIKSTKNPNGDISIKTTKLRPGEKLYEELLIDNKASKTPHPLIYREEGKEINSNLIFNKIKILKSYINNLNLEESLKILKELVPEAKINRNK